MRCISLLAVLILATQPADLDAALDRLDTYLEYYETQLSTLVADEHMTQEVGDPYGLRMKRRLQSEVAFLRLPGDFEWLGFRSVQKVNGKPLTARRPLAEVLASMSDDAVRQASVLVNESAKFNLGTPRTTNMPNLPLELLSRKYRHRYAATHAGKARVRGLDTEIVDLEEIGEQGIVYHEDKRLLTRVRAWIGIADGALHRAHVTFTIKGDNRSPTWLRVEFGQNKSLKMLVPTVMEERFNVIAETGSGVATYNNFRRFGTAARLVPQP